MADTEHDFAPEDVGLNRERLDFIPDYFDKAYLSTGKLPCMMRPPYGEKFRKQVMGRIKK